MYRSSRIPSADSIPQQMDTPLRHSASVTTLSSHAGQQMSKQTLQALSAVPRPRIVQSDQWVQRRKSDVPRGAHDLNYHHHWLIQVNILKFNNYAKSFFEFVYDFFFLNYDVSILCTGSGTKKDQ